MTGAPQPLDTKYTCIEMDLQTLTGYFNAAITGHEMIAPLKRLWEQQLSIIRTSHSSTTSAEVLEAWQEEINLCPYDRCKKRFAELRQQERER